MLSTIYLANFLAKNLVQNDAYKNVDAVNKTAAFLGVNTPSSALNALQANIAKAEFAPAFQEKIIANALNAFISAKSASSLANAAKVMSAYALFDPSLLKTSTFSDLGSPNISNPYALDAFINETLASSLPTQPLDNKAKMPDIIATTAGDYYQSKVLLKSVQTALQQAVQSGDFTAVQNAQATLTSAMKALFAITLPYNQALAYANAKSFYTDAPNQNPYLGLDLVPTADDAYVSARTTLLQELNQVDTSSHSPVNTPVNQPSNSPSQTPTSMPDANVHISLVDGVLTAASALSPVGNIDLKEYSQPSKLTIHASNLGDLQGSMGDDNIKLLSPGVHTKASLNSGDDSLYIKGTNDLNGVLDGGENSAKGDILVVSGQNTLGSVKGFEQINILPKSSLTLLNAQDASYGDITNEGEKWTHNVQTGDGLNLVFSKMPENIKLSSGPGHDNVVLPTPKAYGKDAFITQIDMRGSGTDGYDDMFVKGFNTNAMWNARGFDGKTDLGGGLYAIASTDGRIDFSHNSNGYSSDFSKPGFSDGAIKDDASVKAAIMSLLDNTRYLDTGSPKVAYANTDQGVYIINLGEQAGFNNEDDSVIHLLGVHAGANIDGPHGEANGIDLHSLGEL